MSDQLYYTPVSPEAFEEIKAKCIEIWNTYDDKFGYATEKISRIKDLTNVSDNAMTMIAMFDSNNQLKLSLMLKPATSEEVSDRLDAGGTPRSFNPFYKQKIDFSEKN